MRTRFVNVAASVLVTNGSRFSSGNAPPIASTTTGTDACSTSYERIGRGSTVRPAWIVSM